jgi:hypothetical protein
MASRERFPNRRVDAVISAVPILPDIYLIGTDKSTKRTESDVLPQGEARVDHEWRDDRETQVLNFPAVTAAEERSRFLRRTGIATKLIVIGRGSSGFGIATRTVPERGRGWV